jgi:hypothetical protein
MAYVPNMSYSPEMGFKIKFGKNFLQKIGVVASAIPLPQTQAVGAVSNIVSKAKAVSSAIKSSKSSMSNSDTDNSDTSVEPSEGSNKKFFGLNKKLALIGGGAVGLVLLLIILKKK